MLNTEKKKMLQSHLENARKHAQVACRLGEARLAAQEIKAAIADMSSAVVTHSTEDRNYFEGNF